MALTPRHPRISAGILGLALLGGCATFELEPPAGFAEVHRTDTLTRMKAGDGVGLAVRVFDNVRGGTLAFWGEDLVRKLARRGYVLASHRPIRAADGHEGTLFAFELRTEDGEDAFDHLALFVTDEARVVLEVAGDAVFARAYLDRMDAIAGALDLGRCRPGRSPCDGPQPEPEALLAAADPRP